MQREAVAAEGTAYGDASEFTVVLLAALDVLVHEPGRRDVALRAFDDARDQLMRHLRRDGTAADYLQALDHSLTRLRKTLGAPPSQPVLLVPPGESTLAS